MLKRCWIIICCFISMLLFGLSADAASLGKKFYKDHDNVFVFQYTEKFGITAPGDLDQVSYDGYLALCELDLDSDGSNELLAIRIGDDSITQNNSLYADVYMRIDSEWEKQDSYLLAENVLKYEDSDCSVFLLKKSKGYFLGCEHKEVATVTDDDMLWSLRLASYHRNSFDEVLNLGVDHRPSDKDLKGLKKKFKKYNIPSQDMITTPLRETLSTLSDTFVMVSSIQRERTKQLEALLKHMNYGDGSAFEYGDTIFKSYVNKSWANKNEEDFSGSYVDFEHFEDGSDEDNYDDYFHKDSDVRYDRDYYDDYDDSYLEDYFSSDKEADIIIETENTKRLPSRDYESSNTAGNNYRDPYLEDYYPYADEFIIWDSSVRLLSEEELWNLSYDDLRIARNEIYARHGRIFDNYDLSTYFNSLSWYRERVPAKAFTYEYARTHFNDIEIKNIDLIKAYEEAMGY